MLSNKSGWIDGQKRSTQICVCWPCHWKMAETLALCSEMVLNLADPFTVVECPRSKQNRKCGNHSWLASHMEPAIHSKRRFLFDACVFCFLVVAPNDNRNDIRTMTKTVILGRERRFHIERGCDARMWKPHWVILRCFSRCNFHTQVQEQSACEMLLTFIQAAARHCKPKLPVKSFPQSGQSREVQRYTKSILPARCARPMSTQQPQPLIKDLPQRKCNARVQKPCQDRL